LHLSGANAALAFGFLAPQSVAGYALFRLDAMVGAKAEIAAAFQHSSPGCLR
jgi:hypothetical protein